MMSETVSNEQPKEKQRLLSLDVLRGFDLALLVLIQPVVFAWLEKMQPAQDSFLGIVYSQIEHLPWQGFCFWDIIMPLFMFMSGITVPFAMSKYKTGRTSVDRHFYFRILKRFVVLWVLGMFCQGNLMDLDIRTLKLFSNTLQSIAVGYVVVSFLYVFTSLKTQIGAVVIIFAAYIAVFAVYGGMDFTIGTNICQQIDNNVFGHFRDGVIWSGDSWTFDPEYNYTWILSSLNFIVTVYLGCLAGYILHGKDAAMKKFAKLAGGGVILIVAGLAMNPVIPIIKHIWSSSMTLFSGGICFLLMALFYFCIDVKGWKRGTGWLKFYGMNSLTAYVIFHIPVNSVIDCFFHGFQQWTGEYYIVLQTAVQVTLVFLVIRWMYCRRIFLKA
jgi:predicted acyltransferase